MGLEPIESHARQRHRATRQFRCIRERRTELRDCLARGDRPVRVDDDLGDHPQQDRLHDARGAGDAVEPHELVGVVDDDPADALADGERQLLVGLGVAVQEQADRGCAGAPAREHLAAGGAQQVEPLLERDAKHRRACHRLDRVGDAGKVAAHDAHARAQVHLVEDHQRRAESLGELGRRHLADP